MSVALIVERDPRNIHWSNHYLQSRANYRQSVNYQRIVPGSNHPPQRLTVRLEPHEKRYVGAGCTGSPGTDLCGSIIHTNILTVTPIPNNPALTGDSRAGDSDADSPIEYGIDFIPEGAILEPIEEQ